MAEKTEERRGLERAESPSSRLARIAAGTTFTLLAFAVLLVLAPYGNVDALRAFAASHQVAFIIAIFGLAAASAAGVAACALTLDSSIRPASRLGRVATVAGAIGGILVCVGVLDVAVSLLRDGSTGESSRAVLLAGGALAALWLLALGWLRPRHSTLGPAARGAAALAGISVLVGMTLLHTASFTEGVLILSLGLTAFGVWAFLVATMR